MLTYRRETGEVRQALAAEARQHEAIASMLTYRRETGEVRQALAAEARQIESGSGLPLAAEARQIEKRKRLVPDTTKSKVGTMIRSLCFFI
jgi:hypothetical protein